MGSLQRESISYIGKIPLCLAINLVLRLATCPQLFLPSFISEELSAASANELVCTNEAGARSPAILTCQLGGVEDCSSDVSSGPTEENQIHNNNGHHDENDNVDSGSLSMSQGLYGHSWGHQANAAMASISQMGRLRLGGEVQ